MTRGVIEAYAAVTDGVFTYNTVRDLARSLLAEMDKPKVWTNAPDNATHAEVWFANADLVSNGPVKIYTREPPKSRERQIAEEYFDIESYIGFCEIAILKAKAEWEAGKC